MGSIIWKPQPQNRNKGPVFLVDTNKQGKHQAPTISVNGQTYTGKYLNTENGVDQYEFPRELIGTENLQVSYGDQSGTISQGGQSFEGDSLSNWQPRSKGSVGSYGGASGPFAPGSIGYGATAAYVNYPDPSLMKTAPYKFTDPQEFAQKFGEFNRGEYAKNFEQAQKYSLKTLDTELQALKSYVPAMSALQREQTSIDNQFNQAQRTQQIDTALPGVRSSLAAQGKRAETYAGGNLIDSGQNAALELGMRSQAADNASAGGFGAGSSVARKASDLMSAEKRFQISQYGEGLLGTNVNQRSNLELAPTEYANAGSQIRVNPTVSPAQLLTQQQSELNQNTMISPTNALQSNVQQNQFTTGLEQQTRQINQSVENQFKLGKHAYDVSYSGMLAGASQTDINTQLALQQQAQARQDAIDARKATQRANQAGALTSSITGLLTAGASIINSLRNGKAKPGDTDGNATVLDDGSLQFNDGTRVDSSGNVTDVNGNDLGVVNPGGEFTPNPDTALGLDSDPLGTSYGSSPSTISTTPTTTPTTTDTGSDLLTGIGEGLSDAISSLNPFGGRSMSAATAANLISSPAVKSFVQDTELPAEAATRLAVVGSQDVEHAANLALENSGVSWKPTAGNKEVGVDFSGKPVYMDIDLQRDNNPATGIKPVEDVKNLIGPFQTLDLKPEQFDKISRAAMSPTLTNALDTLAGARNIKGFINTLQEAVGNPKIDSPKVKDAVAPALAAYKLAQTWDKMSGAQKSLAISSVGLQSIKTSDGKPFTSAPIETTRVDGHKPMTVGDSIEIAKTGVNPYAVANQWGDLSSLQIMLGGKKSAAELAQLGKQYGLV